jgi:hypothetical protein
MYLFFKLKTTLFIQISNSFKKFDKKNTNSNSIKIKKSEYANKFTMHIITKCLSINMRK